jgi:L-lactate permease
VLCAIFVYDITVKTGKFEQVRHTIAGLAVDRRIQLLRPCSSASGSGRCRRPACR